MRSEKQSRKLQLQYATVIFLIAVAAWTWYRRSVPYVPPATTFARISQPASTNQPESNSTTWIMNPDLEQARDPQAAFGGHQGRKSTIFAQGIDSNQMVDTDFGLRVFELVCEHGTVEAMQLTLTKTISLPEEYENRINSRLTTLLIAAGWIALS